MIEVSSGQSKSQFDMHTQCCCRCSCCVVLLLLFLFLSGRHRVRFHNKVHDLIDYNFTVRCCSTYENVFVYTCHVRLLLLLLLCTLVVCCYTAVDAAAAACCCCSSSCVGWQHLLLWFITSDSNVFFLFIKTRLISMYPLAALSHLQRRSFTYNTY